MTVLVGDIKSTVELICKHNEQSQFSKEVNTVLKRNHLSKFNKADQMPLICSEKAREKYEGKQS